MDEEKKAMDKELENFTESELENVSGGTGKVKRKKCPSCGIIFKSNVQLGCPNCTKKLITVWVDE